LLIPRIGLASFDAGHGVGIERVADDDESDSGLDGVLFLMLTSSNAAFDELNQAIKRLPEGSYFCVVVDGFSHSWCSSKISFQPNAYPSPKRSAEYVAKVIATEKPLRVVVWSEPSDKRVERIKDVVWEYFAEIEFTRGRRR
jgi:hypothetical protein